MAEQAQRRLAAIVSADVAGYSRLMGRNERGTHAALKAHRAELIDPAIASNGGRIVKTTGDGLLAEFPSVVAAVDCCVAVQDGMAERNAGTDAGNAIRFRIGIHLGDVIADGDDIFGDGVNIAARLQEIGEPGGIAVSAIVHDYLDDELAAGFAELGERELKNIRRPIRVWQRNAQSADVKPTPLPPPEKPSIAVLPFDNMSGDPEQEYFADGISEDVITDLSKVSGLMVIARNSSFAYKGKSADIRQVCRELGVRYVLEGSVRKGGNRVRINAQLINGGDGSHVWADRFDRDLEDIFAVQDDVTREIVGALQVALTPDEDARRSSRRKVDPQAYDLVMRARAHVFGFAREGMQIAREQLSQAIAIDPGMAIAYSWRAIVSAVEYFNGWTDDSARHLDMGLADAEKACTVDPDEPHAHYALGLVQLWRRDLDTALAAEDKAIDLDPNMAGAYAARGNVLEFSGQPERAIDSLQHALRLDPGYDPAVQFLGRAQFACRLFDEAEATFRRRLQLSPRSDVTRVFLAATYGHTGRLGEARQMWAELCQINPNFDVAHLGNVFPYRDTRWFEHLMEGLRKAGLPK